MDWAEILEKQNIPMDVFIEACKLHKAYSEYFPNIKNLLDYCQDVWRERDRKKLRIVEPVPVLSPEQVKENADRVRLAIKKTSESWSIKKNRTDKEVTNERC